MVKYTNTRVPASRELATTVLIFETRRNINETRDRRSNRREKGPRHRVSSPRPSFRSFVPFFFPFALSCKFRFAGIPAAVRSGPQTASGALAHR